jgi:hypothetical protein
MIAAPYEAGFDQVTQKRTADLSPLAPADARLPKTREFSNTRQNVSSGNMTLEILAVIVFLNVMATPILWRNLARRPGKLRKKFYVSFYTASPSHPNISHRRLKEDTWGVAKEGPAPFSTTLETSQMSSRLYLLPGKFRVCGEREIANPPHNLNHSPPRAVISDQKRRG